ncbi:hypothetical protein AgCh_003258 [Apium graveolens]
MTPIPSSYPLNDPLTDDFIYISDSNTPPPTPPGSPTITSTPPSHTQSAIPTVEIPVRRSTRTHKPPLWLDDYTTTNMSTISSTVSTKMSQPFHCFLSTHTMTTNPTSFKIAVQSPHWVQAMNNELDALELNHTWEVTTLPLDYHSIGCKWLFKTKLNPDGSAERHKARLVILGNHQQPWMDFAETFAPVAKLTTVRTLLAVAAIEDWITCQMDVSNAFLHGELQEEVYIRLPPGYTHYGSRIIHNQIPLESSSPQILVCKLLKSLYGLRQAPRNWFSKLSSTLLKIGYKQSKTDYSLFLLNKYDSITAILVYVDDLLISGNCQATIDSLKAMLSSTFHMKDLGKLRYFLGLEIDRDATGIFMCQKKYTLDIIEEFGLTTAKPVLLSMDSYVKLIADDSDLLPNPTVYPTVYR